MEKHRKLFGGMLAVWAFWSCLLAGYEQISRQIPQNMWIYEEDAVEVLSDDQKKIHPQKLQLDFSGDIKLTKKENGSYRAVCSLFGVIPLKTMDVEVVSRQKLFPGGIPVGIYVQTDGVFVVGTGQIETSNGQMMSPAQNIVKTGDYIISFQGEKIRDKKQLIRCLENFTEKELTLGLRRGAEDIFVKLRPVYVDGKCNIGVWVRDDMQGIGMLTYVTEDQRFGALGHGISDSDSSLLMEVSKGKLYDCEISQITRGKSGEPGKLSGRIVYSPEKYYGEISGNRSGGIYGEGNQRLLSKITEKPLEMALKQEVEEGDAVILSSVDGSLREYRIELTKVHKGDRDVNKGMELRVTDEALLTLTGGIVQGMSGSPIIQKGKIVGAVTHVYVNDPTRGYGIFIENMLGAADEMR